MKLPFFVLFAATLAGNVLSSEDLDICVVGGGPAGVYAAYLLEQKGYSVTLFEKEAVVGGKTVPDINPEGTENVRHILTSSMSTIASVIEELGMEGNGTPLPQRNIYTSLGQIIPEGAIPPTQEQLEALQKYVLLTAPTSPLYPYIVASSNTDVPEELTVPFVEWAAANNIAAIVPAFYNIVTNYGYDFLERVPAVYILKYLAFGTFPASNWELYPFHRVIQELGRGLNDLRVNSFVDSIKVKKNFQKIKVTGQKKTTVKCAKTIIAFPQTSKSMAVLKGAGDTKSIFDDVQFVYYHEVIVRNEQLVPGIIPASTSYVQAPKPGTSNEEPNIYLRFQENEGVVVLLNSGEMIYSKDEVLSIVKDHIAKLWSIDLPKEDMLYYGEHVYFPHVSTEVFGDGFYETVAEKQGVENVYFTGALFRFETVDSAMTHAQYLVDQFFP